MEHGNKSPAERKPRTRTGQETGDTSIAKAERGEKGILVTEEPEVQRP